MAKPSNPLLILAHPEPESPPLKPHFKSMANHSSTPPNLDSSTASPPPKLYPLSKHIPFSILQSKKPNTSNPSSAILVPSMVKSKPHLQEIASCGDETLSKVCKDLSVKKFFDDGKALCLVVKEEKEKELKEPRKGNALQCLRPKVSLLGLGDIFSKNGVKVISVDMPPAMQIHAVDCARKVHDSMEKFTSKTLAQSLKREFDRVYGPAWHCIVGTSFGSFVTHSVGGFLYFSMDQKLYILLFKTSVQKAV